ncbi:MAG: hypothetical protein WCT99_12515 [Bacteroidota bacterium]|jgi:hypothetical protein
MTKRPLSVTIIAWIFIAAGIIGIAYHSAEINIHILFGSDILLALFVRLLAIVGGVFLLRRINWGRSLLTVWLAYHVVLSYFHTLPQMLMHAALLAVIVFFLFRPVVNAYFARKNTE